MKTGIIIVLAAAMMSGCGIYTNYQRPETLPVDSLYRDISVDADTTSIATLSWRELFTDSRLAEWI